MRAGQYSRKEIENGLPVENLTKKPSVIKTEKKIKIEHPECNRTSGDRKVSLSKKTEKTYKVIVTYVQLSDEEARIKRAIIESIMKKGYQP